jgi:acetolactate synthase-1/2/3 large subunit
MITGAQAIVRALEAEQVTTVFGYPGAAIMPFYDALLDSSVKHVLTRHEQGAAHAASGYARSSGRTGVCIATSGPGATNLITGIATAYMTLSARWYHRQVYRPDRLPTAFRKPNLGLYPFTKQTYLPRARFCPASSGKPFTCLQRPPGPVLIDIPQMSIPLLSGSRPLTDLPGLAYYASGCRRGPVGQPTNQAKRRSGARRRRDQAPARLMRCANWPNSLNSRSHHHVGIGVLQPATALYGHAGLARSLFCNYALHLADLVVLAGARVGNGRCSAAEIAAAPDRHIDIDPARSARKSRRHAIVGDVRRALDGLMGYAGSRLVTPVAEQVQAIRMTPTSTPSRVPFRTISATLLRLLGKPDPPTRSDHEVGHIQIWAANFFPAASRATSSPPAAWARWGTAALRLGAKVPSREHRMAVTATAACRCRSRNWAHPQKRLPSDRLLNNRPPGYVNELQSLKYKRTPGLLEENPISSTCACLWLRYARLSATTRSGRGRRLVTDPRHTFWYVSFAAGADLVSERRIV